MANFGYEAALETGADNCQGAIRGSVFSCPAAGEAQSITAYVEVVGAQGRDIACSIYRHDTLALVGTTDVWNTATFAKAWHTFLFSDPKPVLAVMDYILVMWSENMPTFSGLYYDDGNGPDPGNQGHWDTEVWPGWPNPLVVSGHADKKYSIYCTYILAGWAGEISGVVNPAEVMGVDKTNIAAVKGVA